MTGKTPPLQQVILSACIKIHRNLPFKISVDLELGPVGKGNLEEPDLPLHDSPPGEASTGVWVKGVPDSQTRECYHQCRNGWRQRTVHRWDLICPRAVFRWIKGRQGRGLEGKQSWSGSPTPWVTCSFWSLSLKKAHRLQGTPEWASAHIPILLRQATFHNPLAFSYRRGDLPWQCPEDSIQIPPGGIACAQLNSREYTDIWGTGEHKLVPREKALKGAYKKQTLYLPVSLSPFKWSRNFTKPFLLHSFNL